MAATDEEESKIEQEAAAAAKAAIESSMVGECFPSRST